MSIFRLTFMLLIPAAALAQQPAFDMRAAVVKPIALLQQVGNSWYEKQTCTSCHQQDLPMMVLRMARERGVQVNDDLRRRVVTKAYGFLSSLDRAVQNVYLIDASMDYGSHLVAAHEAGVPASLTTSVYARFIANRQKSDGSWITIDQRPPQSYSVFTATATAMRAIQFYMPSSLKADARERILRAKNWLLSNRPGNTEDRVSQLRGLGWAGTDEATLKRLAGDLMLQQRSDGGWSQLPNLDSDAYATGEVLVVLHEAAHMPVSDSAWQNGLRFLQKTQLADGSWLVKSRMHEQQIVSPPYFESGFPHREDQMISCLGTSWATAALLLSLGPSSSPPALRIDEAAVTPVSQPWMEAVLFGTNAELEKLLDGGLDPNSRTGEGTTALMMAAHDPAKVRLLIDRGANVNARSKTGFTALMVAANFKGATESVRLLLKKGAEVNTSDTKPMFNASAVIFSVFSGETAALDLLLAKGADPRQKMTLVGTAPVRPLDVAVGQRDVPMVRYLVTKGLNVNEEDPDVPVSLLTAAAMNNDLQTAHALIELGADVNKVDSLGMTPLLHAASVDFGDTEMVKLLLESGASRLTRSKTQQTAQQLAERYGHREIARVLASRN